MLSHVGTINAVKGMAESIVDNNNEIFLLNILGEFKYYQNDNIKVLNLFNFYNLPKSGKFSKIFIYFFSILSIPFLFFYLKKYKPKILVANLVSFIPCFVGIFFKDLKIICSIQGLPKLGKLRTLIWNTFYNRANLIFTMTYKTKEMLENKLRLKSRFIVANNPIISSKIRKLSNFNLNEEEKKYFDSDEKTFVAIGRLTMQKNFNELILFLDKFQKQTLYKFKLLIIGSGEDKPKLEKIINDNKISNFFLLGFKNNPYNILSNSDLYISSSRWEEPGHTLIEAGYLNIPILSSDCPNGPNEIIKHGINGYKYKLGDYDSFANSLNEYFTDDYKKVKTIKKNMKIISKKYTKYEFKKLFISLIN